MPQFWLMTQLLQHKPDAVFQQSGVMPHFHNGVITFLKEQLPDGWT
jgi:hypothetical protein